MTITVTIQVHCHDPGSSPSRRSSKLGGGFWDHPALDISGIVFFQPLCVSHFTAVLVWIGLGPYLVLTLGT